MAEPAVLFIVTGRGGSKGVPKKNIKKINGIPLVGYKVISALKTNIKTKRIICSTDDSEIADAAKRYGAEVPFIRPSELATDTASSFDVVLHAMTWIKENDPEKYDIVFLLEPSSPFGTSLDFQNAIELLQEKNADSVVSVSSAEVSSFFIAPLEDSGKMTNHHNKVKEMMKLRRQDMAQEYYMNGCLYMAKWDYFEKQKKFLGPNTCGYVMPKEYSIEIDELRDFHYAQFIAENGYIDLKHWEL